MNAPWKPTRREQHVLWYLQVVMRYVVGGGGLAYEAAVDHFHEPIALLVFGSLATATDVFSFVKTLIRSAREEQREVERVLREEDDS